MMKMLAQITGRSTAAIVAAIVATLSSAALAQTPASAYTSLGKGCKVLRTAASDPSVELPDFFESICPGRDGMRVIFEGGDSRSNIGLLPRGVAYENGVRFHATMGSFPSIEGKLLEWRYHGSKLVALIVRMVAGSEENGDEFHGLVVFRVDTTKLNQSCAIGKTTSNEEARAIADDPSRPCFQSAYRGRLVIIAVLPAHGTPAFSKNLAYRLETLLGSERV